VGPERFDMIDAALAFARDAAPAHHAAIPIAPKSSKPYGSPWRAGIERIGTLHSAVPTMTFCQRLVAIGAVVH